MKSRKNRVSVRLSRIRWNQFFTILQNTSKMSRVYSYTQPTTITATERTTTITKQPFCCSFRLSSLLGLVGSKNSLARMHETQSQQRQQPTGKMRSPTEKALKRAWIEAKSTHARRVYWWSSRKGKMSDVQYIYTRTIIYLIYIIYIYISICTIMRRSIQCNSTLRQNKRSVIVQIRYQKDSILN